MKTSEKRKQKHPRINLAFYSDNLDYAREAAYQSRMSVTEYINHLIDQDRKRASINWNLLNKYLSGSDDVVVIDPDADCKPLGQELPNAQLSTNKTEG